MLRDVGLAEEMAADRELLRKAGIAISSGAGAYDPAMFPATELTKRALRSQLFKIRTDELRPKTTAVTGEHITIRIHPDDREMHASFIALIHDAIRAGSGATLEVVEDGVSGVITIEREDVEPATRPGRPARGGG